MHILRNQMHKKKFYCFLATTVLGLVGYAFKYKLDSIQIFFCLKTDF